MVPVLVPLRDGTRLRVRRLGPEDRACIAAGFERLSPRSRQSRFLRPVARLDGATLDHLAAIDGDRHLAVAAHSAAGDQVGLARCVRLAEAPEVAEIAVTVLDDWQRRGVAGVLAAELARWADAVAIRRFRAVFHVDNRPVASLLRAAGVPLVPEAGGLLRADVPLATVLSPPASASA